MLLKVNPHKIEIVKEPVNEREINISKCTFEFADEITNDYVKEAYFTFEGTTYKQIIVNNECNFPSEVLTKKGTVEIGVVAYLVENETEIKRYNPSPAYFDTWVGSLKDNAENSEPITPNEMEQFEQALNDGLNEVNDKLDEIDQAIDDVNEAIIETNNLDLDVDKQGKVATVTLTKKDASTKIVTLSDGTSLMFNWDGTKLGIKTDEDAEYTYVDLQGVQGPIGPKGEAFTIKKTYTSVAEMNADFNNMQLGDYVMIASTVEVEDNAKLYTRGETQWIFISDFSGATGIRGETGLTPNIQIGTVISGATPNVTRTGTNENPILNFTLVKGDTGATGPRGETGATGNGILSIQKTATAGLVDTYTITFTDGTTTTFNVTNGEDGEVTQTQLDETNNNVSWLQTLAEQMPHVSGQGTDLSLESVLNYRLMKFLPQGNSSQDGEPTPTTPIPVKSVTGDNSLVLQNENLFDKDNANTLNNNYIGSTSIGIANGAKTLYYECKPNTTYTVSKIASQRFIIGDTSETPANGVIVNNRTADNTGTHITITTSSNAQYLVVFYYLSTADTLTEQEILNSIMIVKGSTAPTTYVEHEEQNYQLSLGNIELNSSPDGTVRDVIYGSPNEWYKREYIGKVVLDGSEDWNILGSGTPNYRYTYNSPYIPLNSNILSNNYVRKSISSGSTNQGIDMGTTGQIRIRYGAEDTISNFKTWLSTHNTIVWYQKEQYTDIPITDTTLINQLNDIYNNAHSYNGVTNITTTYEDGNEQMYLDIEALKNVWDTSL